MKTLSVFIITDPMGDQDEEIQDMVQTLAVHGIPVEVKDRAFGITDDIVNGSADMLIIDYGGMSYGAGGIVSFNIKSACQWAENHPGKLMVLWTAYTRAIYEEEFKKQFGHLDNIIGIWDGGYDYSNYEKIRKWYG